MTPPARIAAASAVLDDILSGSPAEKALIAWARAARFAGSGDRAAVRDLVFSALRCRRSCAWLGGAETGRGLMLGLLRLQGQDPAALMTGQGHALASPAPEEAGRPLDAAPDEVRADCPDWLWPRLGADPGALMAAQRERAPTFLRVNLALASREEARQALAADDIATRPCEVRTALEVTENERKIRNSLAYSGGLVELQDAASQEAVLRLPLKDGMRVLDYCAGGGGKALAMAALHRVEITAHDADPARMADLPQRAARAGQRITLLPGAALPSVPPFDLVLVDAPCSGSGTWRRAPDAKWRLTPARLDELTALQTRILAEAARFVAPGGTLAYATCSILAEENAGSVGRFCAQVPGWLLATEWAHRPGPGGDGFYLALLQKQRLP